MVAEQVSEHFIQQYSSNILFEAQQNRSKLRGTVIPETVTAEVAHWDKWGKREMQRRQQRFGDSPVNPNPRTSRRLVPEAYEDGDFVDSFDKVKLLNDPTAPLVMGMAKAAGRKMDDLILTAAIGTAQTGRSTVTNVALPAANTIAIDNHTFDSGTGNVGLTPGKLRAARARYGQGDIELEAGMMHCAVTQWQLENMLSETEVTSADYNNVKALVNGDIETFLGFQFHIISPSILPISSTTRTVITYKSDAIVLGISKEAGGDISKRADKSFNWYAYFEMYMAATRVEENGVVAILCDEQ